MEVHHHAHHHGPKTWKSYVFEFFMLFLAVFCGFLAEWQLEHVVEHQREETFMRSMVNDLSADIDQAMKLEARLEGELAALDTLVDMLADTLFINDSRRASELWDATAGFPDFVYADGTMQQLKYSGALRLVRNSAVADSILAYDRRVRILQIHQDILNSAVMDRFHMRFFDMRALKLRPEQPIPLLRSTAEDLNEAYVDRSNWQRQMKWQQVYLSGMRVHAGQLRAFIIAQYELEE